MKYKCIMQHDMSDCGAACLATISIQYGRKVSVAKIREAACTDKQGTNALGIIKAARQIGFTAKGVRVNIEDLEYNVPLPAIAHVIINKVQQHYIVIHKITKKKVIIADPSKGIVKMNINNFLETWTGVLILMKPNNEFKKGRETKGFFKRFSYLLNPHKKLLFNIFIASVLYTAIGMVGAFYYKFLIDDIIPYGIENTLHIFSVGAIILIIFNIILQVYRKKLLLFLSQKIDVNLFFEYYNHVINLPINFFENRKAGEIISRFQDISNVRDAISGATLVLMIDTLMTIIGGLVLYFQNSYMFGLTMIIAVLYFLVVFLFNNIFRKQYREQLEKSSLLTSFLVESINGIETIKSYNAENKVKFDTENKFIKLLESVLKVNKTGNIQSALQDFIDNAGGIAIVWIGAYQVLKGNLSIGQLIAYNSLLAYFLGPIKNLINLQPMLQTAIVASERIGEILDLKIEKDKNNKMIPKSLKGTIEIRNLCFKYGLRKLVLDNINVTIKTGEKVAFVGTSGSGKSTLAKLLLNLYTLEKGEIIFNGYNIKEIQIEILRNKIAYVSQETFLFSGTIYDNLILGIEEIELEKVMTVAKMTKADDFISNFPMGYYTLLEENGSNLSSGQRQRIALTRALLKNPDILILDEATSNLDSITEKAIQETINLFSENISTIIIAHRLSTIKYCDKIYIIEEGKVIESGTHYELITLKGKYYDMWNIQEILKDQEYVS